MDRRSVAVTLLALAASPAKAAYQVCRVGSGQRSLGSHDASISAVLDQIRSKPVQRMHPQIRNATRDQTQAHLRAIFPQLIEQNFARMSTASLAMFMRTNSDDSLKRLVSAYRSDLNGLSRVGVLLPVLAARSDERSLARWAAAFGTAPVYDAIARYAPSKLPNFERSASRTIVEPPQDQTFSPNIDMTVLRIFQGFRTAPIGASSFAASIYQTGTFAGAHLSASFAGGYAFGTYVVAPLIENFAPSLWDAIGGTLFELGEKLQGLTGIPISQAQEEACYTFGLADLAPTFEQTGGDYGAVEEWSVAAGYGGGMGFDPCL